MLEDHLRLYRSLAKNKVHYLLIGGAAVIMHGVPRSTLDIDIAIEPELNNVEKLYKALSQAGFGTIRLTTPEKILKNELTVLNDFLRIDILTKPKALDFNVAWKNRVVKKIKNVPVLLASISDIIKCKQAVGRLTDKEDIKALKKII